MCRARAAAAQPLRSLDAGMDESKRRVENNKTEKFGTNAFLRCALAFNGERMFRSGRR